MHVLTGFAILAGRCSQVGRSPFSRCGRNTPTVPSHRLEVSLGPDYAHVPDLLPPRNTSRLQHVSNVANDTAGRAQMARRHAH